MKLEVQDLNGNNLYTGSKSTCKAFIKSHKLQRGTYIVTELKQVITVPKLIEPKLIEPLLKPSNKEAVIPFYKRLF
jgi:hypothetical protein